MANDTAKTLTIGGVTYQIEDEIARQTLLNVVSAVGALQNALDAMTNSDTSTAIETFQEVINFLAGATDEETLIGKITTLQTAINGKVTAETGKGLYPDTDKQKLAALPTNAQLQTALNGKQSTLTFDNTPTAGSNNVVKSGGVKEYVDNALENVPTGDIPTKVSDLTNDAGYITAAALIDVVTGSGDFAMTYDENTDTYNIVRLVPTLIVTQLDAMSESTKNGTFKVSGTNLKGDVTIALPQGTSNWLLSTGGGTGASSLTLSPTNGTLAETTITVAYSGSTDSTGNTITISSTGADSKTVTATYTEHSGPTITTSNAGISISEVGGYQNTATLQITGVMLTGNITAALSGTNASKFSLSKSTFTQNDGTVNDTLTITYSPAAADSGTHSATLTLSSDGATSVVIALTGTVLTQTLSVSPSSLSFSGEASAETAAQVLTLTAANLKNDVSVSVPTGFTATPTTITKANANGATISVKAAGTTASGTLTISSGTLSQTVGLTWEEQVIETEAVDALVSRKCGYSSVDGTTPDIDITFKIKTVASGGTDGGVRIVRKNGEEGLTGSAYPSELAKVVVPSTISINGNTYKVTELGGGCFYNQSGLKIINFASPCNVTSFLNAGNAGSFYSARNFEGTGEVDGLKTFVFPQSVTSIAHNIFNSTKIQKVIVHDNVVSASFSWLGQICSYDFGSGISGLNNNWYSGAAVSELTLRYNGIVGITSNIEDYWSGTLGSSAVKKTIYVPSSLIESYKTSTATNKNWKKIYDADMVEFVAIPE